MNPNFQPVDDDRHAGRRRSKGKGPPQPPPRDYNSGHHNSDFQSKDDCRSRELVEARARAVQMEKTMRWWSDCTANWRDKWTRVRDERNRLREENKQLSIKTNCVVTECGNLKRENLDLVSKYDQLRRKLDAYKSAHENCQITADRKSGAFDEVVSNPRLSLVSEDTHPADAATSREERDLKSNSTCSQESGSRVLSGSPVKNTDSDQIVSDLQVQLEETQLLLQREQSEKRSLGDELDDVRGEMMAMRIHMDDLQRSRKDALNKLNKRDSSASSSEHNDADVISANSHERKLTELRAELEKLQRDNSTEWEKRERLESEKLALERDNKLLRTEISNLHEDISKRNQTMSLATDIKGLHEEMEAKSKELTELRQAHAKCRKMNSDLEVELGHAKRRADQYESDVKKLRSRVDELKHDLASVEDECDQQTNCSRRLQRTNDDLAEQLENLKTQLRHTKSRLRRAASNPNLSEVAHVDAVED